MRSSHLLGSSRAGLASSAVLLRIEFTAMDAFARHWVRSYRTFPPLLETAYTASGGLFLLHFSSDRSGRALPVILALWSPDFPHDAAVGLHPATVRPGRVTILADAGVFVKQIAFVSCSIYNKGSTAQLRRRASADLFRQSCGLKSLKYCAAVGDEGALRMRHAPCGYTKYSCAFQILAWRKISRRICLPNCAVLP